MKLELWVYKLMLQAYPKDFKLEFQNEMLQVFRSQLKDAKLENRTLMFWASVFVDCFCGATREQFFGKGEPMNWLQKIAIFLSVITAFQSLIFLIANAFHLIHSPMYFDEIFANKFLDIFNILRIPIIYTGVFFSFPKPKMKTEWLGIVICGVIIIWSIFPTVLRGFTQSYQDIMFPLFQTSLYVIGFLSIVFARVQFGKNGFNFSQVPTMTKFFAVSFLANFAIPFLIFSLNQYFYSNNQDYLILTSILGNLALAAGIWRSTSTQPKTPNLISSL